MGALRLVVAVGLLTFCSACVPIVLVAGGASSENRKKQARADQDVVYRHYIDNKGLIAKVEVEAACPAPLKGEFDAFLATQRNQNENRLGMGSILMTEFSTKLKADISAWRGRCNQSSEATANVPPETPASTDGGASAPIPKDYDL